MKLVYYYTDFFYYSPNLSEIRDRQAPESILLPQPESHGA